VSLRPAFTGRRIDRKQPIFWEHEGNRGIRLGRWKLVSRHPDGWELYDMDADRVESKDVAAGHRALVGRLASQWDAWAKRARVDSWQGPRRTNWGDEIAATAK
jgi:arylsulfatase A-like enzyme